MDMLTIEEVAQELRVSPRTVRSYIASGRLAVFPIGSKGYRIKREDLDTFIAQTIEERSQEKKSNREKIMSMSKKSHLQGETFTVELPRLLVEQLTSFDPQTAEVLGVDGLITSICREWHGEEVIKRTKARAEELFLSRTKEVEDETKAEEEGKQKSYILQVRNHHGASCGTPPHFDDPDGAYVSYYENQFGEQNIFIYNYQTKEAFLYMGDVGWEHPHTVTEGGKVPGLIYGEDEAMWLFACWMATHYDETIQMFRDEAKKRK